MTSLHSCKPDKIPIEFITNDQSGKLYLYIIYDHIIIFILKINFILSFFIVQNERKEKIQKEKINRTPLQCTHCGQIMKGTFNLNRHIGRFHSEPSN